MLQSRLALSSCSERAAINKKYIKKLVKHMFKVINKDNITTALNHALVAVF